MCVFLLMTIGSMPVRVMAEDAASVIAKAFAHERLDDRAIIAALKDIGSEQKTLLLSSGKWLITQSIEIPSNVDVKLESGAVFEIADANTLSIQGSMETLGIHQIFYGKGKVKFGPGFIREVYPQWWGKVETSDDTKTCQSAIDSGAVIVRFPKAIYNIDPVKVGPKTDPNDDNQWYGGLDLPSNTTLIFDAGAKIKALPTDARVYSILRINGKDNVKIYGAVIEGERVAHKGTTGEWGHGLVIRGSSTQVYVKDVKVSDCWGDGIYIGEGCPDGVYVENSTFDNNRRNACSITNAKNVLFKKCTFSNTHGAGPHKGVDIEPNIEADIIQNVVFEDCYSFNNLTQGFSLARDDKQDQPVSVTFRGCVSDRDGVGFGIDIGPSDTAGVVYISDCTSINARESGFRCTSANLLIQIDGLCIVNPNQSGSKPVFGSGFVIWSVVPYHKDKKKVKLAGNIIAKNVNVSSTDGKAHYALYIDNELGETSGFKNLDIELKTDMANDKRLYKGNGPFLNYCKIKFSDNPVFEATGDINDNLMPAYNGQTITNKGAKKDILLTFNHPRAVSFDSEYMIEVVEPNKINLNFGEYHLFPGNISSCWSEDVGSKIRIKSDGKRWFLVEKTGTWN
jgi:hypothetical protein